MNTDAGLSERFEAHRAHLRGVAYRMLGSLNEADDAVQQTWLRAHATDLSGVENLAGWLTTVTSRVCLDLLRIRQKRNERPLPDAAIDALAADGGGAEPEDEAVLAESVGLALLVVLDRLSPAERVAFVLHDLLAVPFNDIAAVVERSTVATKKLASRARRRVRGGTTVDVPGRAEHRAVVTAFLSAARGGDLDALLALLAPEVVRRADPFLVYRPGDTEWRPSPAVPFGWSDTWWPSTTGSWFSATTVLPPASTSPPSNGRRCPTFPWARRRPTGSPTARTTRDDPGDPGTPRSLHRSWPGDLIARRTDVDAVSLGRRYSACSELCPEVMFLAPDPGLGPVDGQSVGDRRRVRREPLSHNGLCPSRLPRRAPSSAPRQAELVTHRGIDKPRSTPPGGEVAAPAVTSGEAVLAAEAPVLYANDQRHHRSRRSWPSWGCIAGPKAAAYFTRREPGQGPWPGTGPGTIRNGPGTSRR